MPCFSAKLLIYIGRLGKRQLATGTMPRSQLQAFLVD